MATGVPVTYDNASLWSNLTSWTAQQLRDAVSVSKYAESILHKLGYFIPVDDFGQRVLPAATRLNMLEEETVTGGAEALAETIRSVASSAASSVAAQILAPEPSDDVAHSLGSDTGKGLGTFFSYMTSKWALGCILMAVVLNRTHIFAATRRRLRLGWHTRLALRIAPIILLVLYARRILRSIQCQTSPDFSDLRWGNASMKSDLMFANPNMFFNHLTSTLLMGASDKESCEGVQMISTGAEDGHLYGSLSILWPLYGVFCLSQFLETVSYSVQGRCAASETGMTLFEISLAFAEADSALGNQLGWGLLPSSNPTSDQGRGQAIAITRSMILNRVNTPVEVLIVALICIMSHVTSHILGIFLLQTRLRLAQTSFWAIMFLSCILTSFYNFNLDDPASHGLLRFPTVCLIGHIPHLIVLAGIVTCFLIYAIALVLAVVNPAPRDGPDAGVPTAERFGFWARLAEAHGNLQASLSLGDARITAGTDFYTALLRAGMAVISMASEAVYLQEDRRVNLKQHTWLEDERYKELENIRSGLLVSGLPGALGEMSGTIGLVPIAHDQVGFSNGYARERANQSVSKMRVGERKPSMGVGAAERSTRWLLAVEYICMAISLSMRIQSRILLRVMRWCGIRWRPRWLVSRSESAKSAAERQREEERINMAANGGAGAAEGVSRRAGSEGVGNGKMYVPRRGDVDVEGWVRRNMKLRNSNQTPPSEQEVDKQLYKWWLDGGFWGTEDRSGEYQPERGGGQDGIDDDDDDDTTSVVSFATTDHDGDDNNSDNGGEGGGWESWEGEDDELEGGQRTPTQGSFNRSAFGRGDNGREKSPMMDSPMPMSELARLLNPRSPEEREEARTLSAHLESDKILTRSRYAKVLMSQKSRVLLPRGGGGGGGGRPSGGLATTGRDGRWWSPEEEAIVLEQILLSRRAVKNPHPRSSMSMGQEQEEKNMRRSEGGGGIKKDDGGGGGGNMFVENSSSSMKGGNWASGAAGMGENGPQCVVCHSEARTIIVWPCRCLSLCDECRVNLAMNNYGNCVCCRREVVSFSRIYVP